MITVSAALAAYREGHVLRRTAAPERALIAIRHLDQHLGAHKVTTLRDHHFHRYGRKRGVSDSTVRRELGVLSAALRYCVRQRLLAEGDLPYIDRPPESPPREQWLTEGQTQVLLSTLADLEADTRMSRAYRFTVLGLATAARRNAIERLSWPLVDLQEKVVRYDRLPLPVTKKRRVCVPVPEWAMPLLQRMHDERQNQMVLDHAGSIRTTFETLMRTVSMVTGDPVYAALTRHALRHTYATQRLRSGVPIWQVAGLLGDTVETVEATYGHHATDNLRQAANM